MTNIIGNACAWPRVKLGDHVDLLTGFPFKSADYTEDQTGIRLLRGDNIAQGYLRWDGVKRWPVNRRAEVTGFELREGDVILSMDRPWIEAGLKHARVRASDLPVLLVQRVARLRGRSNLYTEYLLYVIGSLSFTNYIKFITTGTAVPHISAENIATYEFPLPPLPVQRKIANILSTWDRAIDLTTQLITAKQQYKRGLIQQLLTGRRRFSAFKKPWHTVRIGDFLSESRIMGSDGSTARKITVKLYGKGVVSKEERNSGSSATKYYQRRSGQFIYSKLDFLNGAFGIIPPSLEGYESTLDLPCFDFKGFVLPQFFLYFVSREEFYTRFVGVALGGRKARRIQVEEFLETKIEVPCKEEQERIVAVLSCIDHELTLLNRKLELLKKQKQGLMQQLLTGKVRVKT